MPESPHRLVNAFQRLVDGTKRPAGLILALSVVAALLVTIMAVPAMAVTGVYASRSVDVLDTLPDYIRPTTLAQKSEIYSTNSDGSNNLLATVFDQNRQEVGWEDIAQSVKDAVVSTEDRALSPDLQRWMYKRAGSKVTEIKASHSVYISQPEAVAKVIEDAASVIK